MLTWKWVDAAEVSQEPLTQDSSLTEEMASNAINTIINHYQGQLAQVSHFLPSKCFQSTHTSLNTQVSSESFEKTSLGFHSRLESRVCGTGSEPTASPSKGKRKDPTPIFSKLPVQEPCCVSYGTILTMLTEGKSEKKIQGADY